MDPGDFDAVSFEFACWRCGQRTATEIQTKLHQGERGRTLREGDEVQLGRVGDPEAFMFDVVLRDPEADGELEAAHDWRCPGCKLINWVRVRIEGHRFAGVEPVDWDGAGAEGVHIADGGGVTSYLFRDAGMDCWIDPITLEVMARRKKGQTSVEPYRETLSSILPGRFRTLLASARFRSEHPYKQEDYALVFTYEAGQLRRDLANTARLFREHAAEFPRYLPASS